MSVYEDEDGIDGPFNQAMARAMREDAAAMGSASLVIREEQRVIRRKAVTLTGAIRLPTAARMIRGMKTICAVCRKPIADEFFIGGFQEDGPNLKLHEGCAPAGALAMATAQAALDRAKAVNAPAAELDRLRERYRALVKD